VEGREPCPLPDDPVLAEAAVALNAAGQWAEIVERSWRLIYTTDDLRLAQGAMLHPNAYMTIMNVTTRTPKAVSMKPV
jgi:hypothetical protein